MRMSNKVKETLKLLGEYEKTKASDWIHTSYFFEAVLGGLLAQTFSSDSGWKKKVYGTDPNSPWQPVVLGWKNQCPLNMTYSARKISNDKTQTARVLSDAGLPTIQHFFIPEDGLVDPIVNFGDSVGWPIIIKPVKGEGGKGVITDITCKNLREMIVNKIPETSYIAQKQIDGFEYRIYASKNKLIAAHCRVPAHVVGDTNKSTIRQLIEKKNSEKASHPGLQYRLTKLDSSDLHTALLFQGLSLDSVPMNGEIIPTSFAGNITNGGYSVGVTRDLHPSIADLAIRTVRAMPDRPYAGVDFLLSRGHRTPLDKQDAVIIEVNNPGRQQGHLFPLYGEPVNVVREVISDAIETAKITATPYKETLKVVCSLFGKRLGNSKKLHSFLTEHNDTLTQMVGTDSSLTFGAEVKTDDLKDFLDSLCDLGAEHILACRQDAMSERRLKMIEYLGGLTRLPRSLLSY